MADLAPRDCGVCGVPASHEEVVCPGYAVPRCDAHRGHPPYQAESRLETALAERDQLKKDMDRLLAWAVQLRDAESSRLHYAALKGLYAVVKELEDEGAVFFCQRCTNKTEQHG